MLSNIRCTNLKYLLLKSTFQRNICTSIVLLNNSKDHYEVLGLQRDCSQKEIKNSFIELSRKHHPDMKDLNDDCDKEFKKILEAYQVLSKPHSRANYDLALRGIHTVNYVTEDIVHRPYEPPQKRYEPASPDDDNYYGIKGLKKVSNWKIVLACAIFCGLGIVVQYFTITKSFTFKREFLEQQTVLYSQLHKKTREEALRNSNVKNLEKLLDRMGEKSDQ